VPDTLQHRVLFWGILGAVFMRAVFIFGGVTLVERFGFLMYVFGAFLIFTGLKMALPEKAEEQDLEKNFLVRLGRRIFPLTPELRGRHFLVREGGRWMASPLLLVLLVIEGTDVLFAVDSIPAVMGVLPPEMSSQGKLFIAFTSNIFAILGLRSLFFALAGLMKFFRHLKTGLAFILAFIGAKMVLTEAGLVHIPTWVSLAVLAGALAVSVGVSVVWKKSAVK
jgi:tellurite resistance protein TerC